MLLCLGESMWSVCSKLSLTNLTIAKDRKKVTQVCYKAAYDFLAMSF